MGFLNPLMLLGVGAVSVPIIIHLMNRRKFQRMAWAAMRFVLASIKKNQRRLRIEDLILLILRCALLTLLAVALSRPTVRGAMAGMFGSGRIAAVLVLDNSASMSTTDGVAARFEQAKTAAEQTLDALPGGTAVAVLLANDATQALIAEPTFDRNLVRRTIRNAELSDRSTDLLPAFREARRILANRTGSQRELYVFTDHQRSAWRELPSLGEVLGDGENAVRATVVLVGSAETRNLAVSDLRLASGLAPVGRTARLEARVTNHGAEAATAVRVNVSMDGLPPSDEATIAVIAPGESQTVALHARPATAGYHAFTASIAADHVPFDNQRTIAVRAIERINVLLVDGDPGIEPRDAETFFLRNALIPVAATEADRWFIQTRTVSAASLPTARLEDYDAVVLANVADLSAGTVEALAPFLRRGGGLVLFPGDNTQAAYYDKVLYAERHYLPAPYGEAEGDAKDADKAIALQDKNFEHPIAALWNDPASGRPSAAGFRRIMPLKPAEESNVGPDAGGPQVVLRYADGRPAVMERPWGLGRVVQFSSTADTAWNNLPTRTPGVYLPLLYRVLGSIIQRQDEALNVVAGQPMTWRAPNELLGTDALIETPGGAKGTRAGRKIEQRDRGVVLRFDDTGRAGAYTATIDSQPQREVIFAAQPDPAESSLDELQPSRLQTLAAKARVIEYRPGEAIAATLGAQRAGSELWLPLAMLAVLVAGTETYLAKRFSESK